jgi:hypothetical protein
MSNELSVRFIFRALGLNDARDLDTRDEVTVLMPMPPRRGELVEHVGIHYRVEDIRYAVGKRYEPVTVVVDCFAVMPQGDR